MRRTILFCVVLFLTASATASAEPISIVGNHYFQPDEIGNGRIMIVPKPSTFVLLAAGVAGLMFLAWRRWQQTIMLLNRQALTVVACFLCVFICATSVSAERIAQFEFNSTLLPNITSDHISGAISYGTSSSITATIDLSEGHPSPAFFSDGWRFIENYAYFSFDIENGYSLTLDRLEFDSKSENYAGFIGPNSYNVKYRTNGSSFTSISGGWKSLSANNSWYADRTADNGGSPISGLTGTIDFRIYGFGASSPFSYWFHDEVEVFGTVVPEPATMSLLMVGGLCVLGYYYRRQHCIRAGQA